MVTESTLTPQECDAQHGLMTDPKEYASLLGGLPTDWQPLTLEPVRPS